MMLNNAKKYILIFFIINVFVSFTLDTAGANIDGVVYGPSHPDYDYFQNNRFGNPKLFFLIDSEDLNSVVLPDLSSSGAAIECSPISGISRDSDEYQCINGFEPISPNLPHPVNSFTDNYRVDWGEHCDNSALAGRTCSLRMGEGYIGDLSCDNFEIDESECYNLFDSVTSENCGNGVLDAGEECDYAAMGTVDCSLECLDNVAVDCSLVETIEEACYCEDGGTGKNKYLSYEIDMNREDASKRQDLLQTSGCCGDEENEFAIRMPAFNYLEPDLNLFYADNVYACCDESTDCSYKGRCVNFGESIEENPRYACGPSNMIVESLDFEYIIQGDNVIKRANVDTSERFKTQDGPREFDFNEDAKQNLIACNNDITVLTSLQEPVGDYFDSGKVVPQNDVNVPQIWLPVSQCEGGTLKVRIIDSLGKYTIEADMTLIMELYDYGMSGVTTPVDFENNKRYRTLEYSESNLDAEGYYTISNVLGTYFTIVVMSSTGYTGVKTSVRIDYDGVTSIEIEAMKGDACIGCIDYGKGGICSSECRGRAIKGFDCKFPNDFVLSSCDSQFPGNLVSTEDGNVYRCCPGVNNNWLVGKHIERVTSDISCEGPDLLTKRYVVMWNNQPTDVVVSTCK